MRILKIRFLMPVFIFGIMIFFFWQGLGRDPHFLPSKRIGHPVPSFQAPSLDGEFGIASQFFRGKITLLNVWATWCTACQIEHPFLIDLAKKNGIQLYGLNYKDDRQAAIEYIAKKGNPFRGIIYDPQGKYASLFGVYGTPETYLIDKNGIVRYRTVGPMTLDTVEKDLLPRIAQLQLEK